MEPPPCSQARRPWWAISNPFDSSVNQVFISWRAYFEAGQATQIVGIGFGRLKGIAEYFVIHVVNMLPLGVPRVGAAGCWRPGAV